MEGQNIRVSDGLALKEFRDCFQFHGKPTVIIYITSATTANSDNGNNYININNNNSVDNNG